MKRFLAAALLLSSTAWADIAPPNLSGCRDKEAGATCETDDARSGICQKSTCSRNDYSNGPPPKVVDYECLQCAPANTSHTTDTTVHTTPIPTQGKSSGCTTAPGAPLALLVLVSGGLLYRRRRIG
jgi:uncharacterized protein (TIGR03382 family)